MSRALARRAASRMGLAFAAAVAIAAPPGAWQALRSDPAEGHDPEPRPHNVAYDGSFTFARLRYRTGPGGYYYYGLPAWAHGYPQSERNLMRILNEMTFVRPRIDATNVFALDDPRLLHFPVAYMTEAGFWTLNDREAAGLRAYLLKGGFAIFDDFRDPPLGGGGWANFEANMRRVIPGANFVDLTQADPIFHSFFEIRSLDIPQFYDQGRPILRGVHVDNDPRKPLMAIANFNTDVSNFWEFSATGMRPIDEANEAYKLGVNYIVYAQSH
jgi:hypothetical protein